MEEKNVAIYLDFENLAISALEAYRGIEMPLKIEPIIQFARTKGTPKIKKVYADWSKKKFSLYQKELLMNGFELIHLPETNLLGKNGSDMRLVIDVMEHLHEEPKPDIVLIGSGDSDFIPLIQHMQQRNTEVILLSFEHSVSDMIKHYCSEFKPLKELLGPQKSPRPHQPQGNRNGQAEQHVSSNYRNGKAFLQRYLAERKNDKDVIALSELKQDILKFDPAFSEESYGFIKFKKFIKAYKGDLIEDLEKKDQQWWVIVKKIQKEKKEENSPQKVAKNSPDFEAARELVKQLIARRKQDHPLPMARFKPLLTKLDPTFSEKKLGYRFFKQFVEDLVGDLIDEITEDGYTLYVHFKEKNKRLDVIKAENPAKNEAKTYLDEHLLFQFELSDRLQMGANLLEGMQRYKGMTLPQMKAYLQIHTGLIADDYLFEKYVHLLHQNDLFVQVESEPQASSPLFQLKAGYDRPDKLDEAYIEAIGKELSQQFESLSSGDILDLLFALPQKDSEKIHS